MNAGKDVRLFYASDGEEELKKNWRLHAIGVQAATDPSHPYDFGEEIVPIMVDMIALWFCCPWWCCSSPPLRL